MRPFLNTSNSLGFDAPNNDLIGNSSGINGFENNNDLFDPFPATSKNNATASLFPYERERDFYSLPTYGSKQGSHSHYPPPPPQSNFLDGRESRGIFPPREGYRHDPYSRERERDLLMMYGRDKDVRDRDMYPPAAAPRPYGSQAYNRYDNFPSNNPPSAFNGHYKDPMREGSSYHPHMPSHSLPQHHHSHHLHQAPQHQHLGSMSNHRHAPGSIALAKGALFVGDLSFFTSEADLRRLFAPFGKLKRAEVKRGRFGDSLMHGFVELDVLAGAQRAMQELDGIKFMGRRIRVHWAYSNAEKSSPKDREAWTQLHVTFTSPRIDILLSEDILDRLFSRFGEVADVTVKKHSRILEPQSFQSGYAFVYFYETSPAIEAAERFKNTVVADVHFETSLSFRSQRIVENSLAASKAAAQSLASGSQLEALLFSDLTGNSSTSNTVPSLSSIIDQNLSSAIGSGNKWMMENENFSVVSESAQTQLSEFDRETMLFVHSQQTSDSSLYLYGNNHGVDTSKNNLDVPLAKDNDPHILSKAVAVSLLAAPSSDMDSFAQQLSAISKKLDKTQLNEALLGSDSGLSAQLEESQTSQSVDADPEN